MPTVTLCFLLDAARVTIANCECIVAVLLVTAGVVDELFDRTKRVQLAYRPLTIVDRKTAIFGSVNDYGQNRPLTRHLRGRTTESRP